MEVGAAAKQAASLKNTKYSDITSTHVFYPIAIETAGSWDTHATELIEEIGRRITKAMEDPKETTYLFQRISITIQRGNAMSFFNTFDRTDVYETITVNAQTILQFLACRLCARGRLKKNNKK